MENKELYRYLLGISEPWGVERVGLEMGLLARDKIRALMEALEPEETP